MIEKSEQYKDFTLDFEQRDINRDSCLSLAVLKGFFINDYVIKNPHQNHFEFVKILVNQSKSLLNGYTNMNNPLHWCVYNGHYDAGMFLLAQNPLLIIQTNQDGESPLELIMSYKINRYTYPESRILFKGLFKQLIVFINDYLKEGKRNDSINKNIPFFYTFLDIILKQVDEKKKNDPIKVYIFEKSNPLMKEKEMHFLHDGNYL